MTVIEKELIRFTVFHHPSLANDETIRELRRDNQLPVAHGETDLATVVPDVGGPVVGDVQIQGSVAVDVCQRQGGAAEAAGGARAGGDVCEMAMAIVQIAQDALANRGNQQIEPAIPVKIGKDCAAREFACSFQARLSSDIGERPITQVFVESVGGIQAAQKNVEPPVVIVITQGQA